MDQPQKVWMEVDAGERKVIERRRFQKMRMELIQAQSELAESEKAIEALKKTCKTEKARAALRAMIEEHNAKVIETNGKRAEYDASPFKDESPLQEIFEVFGIEL